MCAEAINCDGLFHHDLRQCKEANNGSKRLCLIHKAASTVVYAHSLHDAPLILLTCMATAP